MEQRAEHNSHTFRQIQASFEHQEKATHSLIQEIKERDIRVEDLEQRFKYEFQRLTKSQKEKKNVVQEQIKKLSEVKDIKPQVDFAILTKHCEDQKVMIKVLTMAIKGKSNDYLTIKGICYGVIIGFSLITLGNS